MIDIHQKAIELLTELSDGDRESLTESLEQNYQVFIGYVPDIYHKQFENELRGLLSI